ncbi:MAG TPA: efflux RND transporter permease subunit, partial [Caulobacter sp.]|nr:efflux RND transporter permease subunit [Caulobacter sp.]
MITALIEGAIKRRKVVLGIAAIASLFGFFTYLNLPRESEPDITVPFVMIQVPYPGVSPEDSERLLVRPIERELQSLEGLKEMNAVAMQNAAMVYLEFEVNFNKDKVLQDVRARVDMARGRFPPDAEEPIIMEQNISDDPFIGIMLSGGAPERALFKTAQELQDRLEALPGVLRTELFGGREEVMEVTIDPARMEAANVTAPELAMVIARNNQLVPAGNLQTREGKFAVKVPGVVEDPADILALPIKRNGDRLITIGDIGEVRRTFKEPSRISRFNGQPAFGIDVIKRPGANILDSVKEVRRVAAEEQANWKSQGIDTIQVDFTFDESEFIEQSLTILESGLIIATILVMIIIVGSLGVRQGLMVGLSIPLCFMMGFLLLQAFGITLNMMVMFGLVLAVGILVDGGIVVVEYADRKMAEGMDREKAFAAAGARMFWPVVNGTLTTLCAFIPFLFWNSIPGKFMSFLPITLIMVLTSSIFVALIFTPALGSIFGRKQGVDAEHLAEIEKSERGDPREMSGFMGWYARTLWWAGHHPFRVTAAAMVIVVAIGFAFFGQKHRSEFFLDQDPEFVAIYVKARGNLSATAADELVRKVEARLEGVTGIESIYASAGRFTGGGNFGPPNDTVGRIQVQFADFEARKELGLRGKDIEADIRARVQDVPGVLVEVRPPQNGPPQGKDVQVQLRGGDPRALDRAADQIKTHMAADPQLIEHEDSRASPGIEWNISVDREAAGRYGVDVLSVGQAIQFVTDGVLVGRFRPDDSEDELDIRVRFTPESRNLASFRELKIMTPMGPVPASYLIKEAPGQQVTTIQRRDGQRMITIQANAGPGIAANQKIGEMKAWLGKQDFGPSVHWKFTGADEEGAEAAQFFAVAMLATLFMMGIILLWQFNSFYGIVVTLSAVILSVAGVLLGVVVNLAHTFDYISVIMLGTGVIALAGVVVGHNIVLVDTFYQLRRQGYPADEAAMRAAVQRFRPVMLTTVVTVIGLLPLMFQLHPNFRGFHLEYKAPGSEWWVQLSASVVWGLSFSTLLTLFLTPAALAAPRTLARRFGNVWAMARHGQRWSDRRRHGEEVRREDQADTPLPRAAE